MANFTFTDAWMVGFVGITLLYSDTLRYLELSDMTLFDMGAVQCV